MRVGGSIFRFIVASTAFIAVSVVYLSTSTEDGFDCRALCPKKSAKNYHKECFEYALPPFPICWFHSIDYFVDKSIDGASRCCGSDTSECRCPKKDTPEFQDRIEDWCTGIRKYCVPCDNVDEEGNCEDDQQQQHQDDVVTIDFTMIKEEESSPFKMDLLSREEREETTLGTNSLPDDHIPYHDRSLQVGGSYHDDRCPTDDTYESKCLESVIPPYPICTKKGVDEWVENALKGYDHCCNGGGPETALCKCPKRNTSQFASKIGDWCAGVETCSSPGLGITTTSSSSIVMQEQEDEVTATLRTSKERLEVAAVENESGDE